MFGNVGALGQGMFGGLGRVYRAGNRALHPYSNRLLLAGMGMLGGGPQDAMKGLVAGSALDTEDADRTKLDKALQELMNDPNSALMSGLGGPDKAYLAADKDAFHALIGARLKPADLTDMRQNYNDAIADGSFTGGFFDYQQAVARANKSDTNINTVGKFSDITTLRKDFENQPGVSGYRQSIPRLKSMAGSVNDTSKMSDFDFVYGMAQIFDPNSVVRKEEGQMVIDSQAVPDSIKGKIAQLTTGGAAIGLQARRDLVAVASRRVGEYRSQAEAEAQYYQDLATRYGIDPQDIVRALEKMPEVGAVSNVPFTVEP
jgi:hypothetical protein